MECSHVVGAEASCQQPGLWVSHVGSGYWTLSCPQMKDPKPEPRSQVTPEFLTYRKCDNKYCDFKLLNLRLFYLVIKFPHMYIYIYMCIYIHIYIVSCYFLIFLYYNWVNSSCIGLSTQLSWKNLPVMQKTPVQSLSQENLLEKEMATHSSILAWRIPWTEEPDGLQSMGSQELDLV